MKIVTWKEFMKLPMGTVFSFYEPMAFNNLMIKTSDLQRSDFDFYYCSLVGAVDNDDTGDFLDKCTAMEEEGASFPANFEMENRDGMFDTDRLFAIYEILDVEELIRVLKETIY
jgi:hypothetical protein